MSYKTKTGEEVAGETDEFLLWLVLLQLRGRLKIVDNSAKLVKSV